MRIRCTNKLLKFLGKEARACALQDTSEESPADWFANLFWIERRKCILFTNVGTLFPFITLDVRKDSVRDFGEFFRNEYERILEYIGIQRPDISAELLRIGSPIIGKSRNRKVLGSMNDYTSLTYLYVEQEGGLANADSRAISIRLSEAPMGAISYERGIDLLRKRVIGDT